MISSRRYTIRQCLMAFGAALVLPGLVFAALLLWRYSSSEQGRYEEEALGTAQRIVAAVDRELVGIQASAEALATSSSLLEGNFEAFHRQAQMTLQSWSRQRTDDYAIVVRDATGQQVVNTRLPWGSPLCSLSPIEQSSVRARAPSTVLLMRLWRSPGPADVRRGPARSSPPAPGPSRWRAAREGTSEQARGASGTTPQPRQPQDAGSAPDEAAGARRPAAASGPTAHGASSSRAVQERMGRLEGWHAPEVGGGIDVADERAQQLHPSVEGRDRRHEPRHGHGREVRRTVGARRA